MTVTKKTILAISGSIREHSTSKSLLKIIGELGSEHLILEFYSGLAQLPYFNPDIEPDELLTVRQFYTALKNADGVIICTPEYVFSLPGVLKNAIEWTVSTTIFAHKPLAVIVASASGEKALESLLLVMTTVGAKIPKEASLLIQGAQGKLDEHGQITDPNLLLKLNQLIAALVKAIDT